MSQLTLTGVGPSAGGFSPLNVSGLLFWGKADAGTYQDTGKTTPASSDGDAVGAWEDQSGNGNDVTQGTAGNKPTLKLNIKNGLPVLRHDGGDYLYRADSLGLTGSDTPFTAFILAEADSFAANRTLLSIGSSSSGTPYHRIVFSTTPNYFIQRHDDAAGGASSFSAGTPVANTWYVITQIFYGTTVTVRVNASTVGAAGSALNEGTLTVDQFTTGALLRNAGGEQPHLGDMAEVVVYDSALAQVDYEAVEAYLNNKWAIY